MAVHHHEMRTSRLQVILHDCEGGLSGLRALTHKDQGDNIFYKGLGGLNFEYIFDGVRPQSGEFEPRHTPMTLEPVSHTEARLHQDPTPFWKLESHLTYRLREPQYVDLEMEYTPRAAVTKSGYLGVFWCSYMNRPPDNRLHFIGHNKGEHGGGWFHVASSLHKVESAFYHSEHQAEVIATDDESPCLALNEAAVRYDKPFYYGLRGEFAFIMMFNKPQQTIFAHSPTAGRPGDPAHPAWDFAFFVERPEVDRTYRFQARLAYKRFEGEDNVQEEWARWLTETLGRTTGEHG